MLLVVLLVFFNNKIDWFFIFFTFVVDVLINFVFYCREIVFVVKLLLVSGVSWVGKEVCVFIFGGFVNSLIIVFYYNWFYLRFFVFLFCVFEVLF